MWKNTTKTIFALLFLVVWILALLWIVLIQEDLIAIQGFEQLNIEQETPLPSLMPTEVAPLVVSPPPTLIPVPTKTLYTISTPIPGCYPENRAKTTIAMWIRTQPHSSSRKAHYPIGVNIYSHIPADVEFNVLDSLQQPDYCWLYLGSEFGNGWVAKTNGITTPKKKKKPEVDSRNSVCTTLFTKYCEGQ